MLPANKLFQISQDYMQLLGLIEEAEGEVTPEIDQQLQFTEHRLRTEASNVACLIKTIDYWTDSVEQEIKRLEEIRRKAIKGKELLKNRLSAAMQQFGIERLVDPYITMSFRKSEAVEVTDETMIPETYLEPQPSKIDKLKIKDALKKGVAVPGAELVQRKNLQIK
jgi:hypothetical protein